LFNPVSVETDTTGPSGIFKCKFPYGPNWLHTLRDGASTAFDIGADYSWRDPRLAVLLSALGKTVSGVKFDMVTEYEDIANTEIAWKAAVEITKHPQGQELVPSSLMDEDIVIAMGKCDFTNPVLAVYYSRHHLTGDAYGKNGYVGPDEDSVDMFSRWYFTGQYKKKPGFEGL
jgi:hypothetical protein